MAKNRVIYVFWLCCICVFYAYQPIRADEELLDFHLAVNDWNRKLEADQRLTRSLDLDPICDLSFNLKQDAAKLARLEIVYHLGLGDRLQVVLTSPGGMPGKAASDLVEIIAVTKKGFLFPTRTTTLLRKATILPHKDHLNGRWTIRFRFGELVVEGPRKTYVASYLQSPLGEELTTNPQMVDQIEICLPKGTVSLTETEIRGRKAVSLTSNLRTASRLALKSAEMKSDFARGRIPDSLKAAHAAEQLANQLYYPKHPNIASAIAHQALCHFVAQDFQTAKRAFKKAIELCSESLGPTHPHTLLISANLATCLSACGQHYEAKKMLQLVNAAILLHGPATSELAIRIQNNLAAASRETGNLAEALELLQGVLDQQLKSHGKTEEYAYALSNRAIVQFQLLLRRGAQDPAARLEQILIDLEETAQILKQLSGKSGRPANPFQALQKRAIALNGPGIDLPTAVLNQTAVLITLGKMNDVRATLDSLTDYPNHQSFVENQRGVVELTLGNPQSSIRHFQKSLQILEAKVGKNHPDSLTALTNLGAARLAADDFAGAEQDWIEASKRLKSVASLIGVTGQQQAPFLAFASPNAHLAVLKARRDKPIEAWIAWERGLSQGLQTDLVGTSQQITDSEKHEKRVQLFGRIRAINQAIPNLKDNGADAAALQAEMFNALKDLEILTPAPPLLTAPAVSLEALKECIPENTALIGWLDVSLLQAGATPYDEHWAVILRHAAPVQWIKLEISNDERLAELKLRQMLSQRTVQKLPQTIQVVRKNRWRPVENALQTGSPSIRNLVVLPSPGLSGIPVELLAGDRYCVNYAPSATVYAFLRSKHALSKNAKDRMFVVSPKTSSLNADQLIGSKVFLNRIEHLLPRDAIKVLRDRAASNKLLQEPEIRLQLSNYRFLHFDTHGQAGVKPFSSRLILFDDYESGEARSVSGQTTDLNDLTAATVLTTWQLNAECTVLSACETASLTDFWQHEGYLGFAYAFLATGSKNVVVTRWKVPDLAALLITSRFYENVLAQHNQQRDVAGKSFSSGERMNVAEALEESKRWLRDLNDNEIRNNVVVQKYAAELKLNLKLDKDWLTFNRTLTENLRGVSIGSVPPTKAPFASRQTIFGHPNIWGAFFAIGASN